jgi:hypothetical protein
VSSDYRLVCLSHNPGLGIGTEYVSPDEAVSALGTMLPDHGDCDVVLGRWSGALVELGCLGGRRPGHGSLYHVVVLWTRAEWLALALAVVQNGSHPESVVRVLERATRDCWTVDRLTRMRNLLATEAWT